MSFNSPFATALQWWLNNHEEQDNDLRMMIGGYMNCYKNGTIESLKEKLFEANHHHSFWIRSNLCEAFREYVNVNNDVLSVVLLSEADLYFVQDCDWLALEQQTSNEQ